MQRMYAATAMACVGRVAAVADAGERFRRRTERAIFASEAKR